MKRNNRKTQPAAFNTRNARNVTHGLGSFILPNRIHVLPSYTALGHN